MEIETRPSRLGLARVAVVRGSEGPLQNTPVIDDYIRMTETVYDYLTPFSGTLPIIKGHPFLILSMLQAKSKNENVRRAKVAKLDNYSNVRCVMPLILPCDNRQFLI